MKTEKLNNRIIKYKITDEHNGMLLYYTLDLDIFELTITGETVGSYKWINTEPHETFIHLLKRCDSGYILGKLFKRKWSNENAIKRALDILEQYEDEYENYQEIVEKIKGIESDNYGHFMRELEEIFTINSGYWSPKYEDVFYEFWDYDLEEYDYWDTKSVELFVKYVAPILGEQR